MYRYMYNVCRLTERSKANKLYYIILTMYFYLFQSCLIAVAVPDPDVLPQHAKSKLGKSGSIPELAKLPVSGIFRSPELCSC